MRTRWLSLGLLVVVIGSACKREGARGEAPATSASVTTADTAWDSPEAVRLSGVHYTPPARAFGVLGVTPSDYFDSIGPGYKIGTFVDGKYRGADFVSAERHTDEPCKGPGCEERAYLRFVKVGNQLVFLRQNSDGGWDLDHGSRVVWTEAFLAAGLSLASDSQFAVQAFLPSETISYSSETFRRVSRGCDTASLRVAFVHPALRGVRFDGQLFHVSRPDGSCLTFEYMPYFSEKEIVWDRPPKEPDRSGYSWKKGTEYGNLDVRYDPFVPAGRVQLDRDTAIVGHTPRGEPVFELKDPEHPLLKEFYEDYVADYDKALQAARERGYRDDEASGIQPPKRSYEQFLGARPIFLWRDPFGRLMRFTNNDFLPVYMAEPIIYLYPIAAQRVHVEAKPLHSIRASIPRYGTGWDVLALPSGELTGVTDRKAYSYLFWEGLSSISPMRQEGFVISQQEVAGFLERMLPRLGLNERESSDFRDAWLPRFHDAPYYFITFLPRETIDRLAPLVVTPKPDAVIRVLMDFRPLRSRERVRAPDLPTPPERRGFTVVEWGGLLRR